MMSKLTLVFIPLFCLICANAFADATENPLFAKANVAAGKNLHETNCTSCHASSYGGDGSGMYTRDYAKVKTSKGLVTL